MITVEMLYMLFSRHGVVGESIYPGTAVSVLQFWWAERFPWHWKPYASHVRDAGNGNLRVSFLGVLRDEVLPLEQAVIKVRAWLSR